MAWCAGAFDCLPWVGQQQYRAVSTFQDDDNAHNALTSMTEQ